MKQLLNTNKPGEEVKFSDDISSAFVYSKNGKMPFILEEIEKYASHKSPILISGETGTGKEQIVKIIHGLSQARGPLVSFNCSAIPHELLENELFGHEKGAYTGAGDSTEGFIGRAKNGTLFMDEIGEMSPYGQVKILRLIQDGEYEKIGSEKSIRTNARFIFATNKNLLNEVRNSNFRADLFYRINTFEVKLPPLRERKEDIPFLIEHFLWIASQELNREPFQISDDALEKLICYEWPGNIRELENSILRAATVTENSLIEEKHIHIFNYENTFSGKLELLSKMKEDYKILEKELIEESLNFNSGNISAAALAVNMSRGTFRYKMKQYGLE
ncbi:MAG: sigma-54 dependent transcriptional regulator [Spirochaetia bacterium]|nr:sigma-54 dependent transcriptional regulator [Spirochaetia bacterium]